MQISPAFFRWRCSNVLYIYLFFRMLKENAERETKYQSMIDTFSGSILKGIDGIQDRLDIISQIPKSQNITGG